MTNLEKLIKEVLDLNEKATPGPWYKQHEYHGAYNQELTAHYRTSCVKIAKVCEVLQAALIEQCNMEETEETLSEVEKILK